jgi:hypothetical protein
MNDENDTALPSIIVDECDRLDLNTRWRETISTLLHQFESAYPQHLRVVEDDQLPPPCTDVMNRPTIHILETLRQINAHDPDRLKRVLFSRAVSKFPVFYLRYRRTTEQGAEFWDPLAEHLSSFVQRGEPDNSHVRHYTADAPVQGDDIIQARIYRALGGDA